MSKVCVLVGAGPGVGHSVAKKFLDKGYSIALMARSAEKLTAMKNQLGEANVSTWTVDVSDSESLLNAMSSVAKQHGSPEILVFNAYSAAPGKPTDLQAKALEESFVVNVTSALIASQAVIPAMKQAGKGTIVFTGGGFALYPLSDLTALSIGKAGLRALSNCLHQELKPLGIHAGTVTICGTVEAGGPFDPDKIADTFVEFHDQSPESFAPEIMFQGR
ncbi:MAG: SDR family NAD(P)-dependent oxidoreductase [Leptolyngbya sp.]|nr:SDR family NAD(P)-dependent oxidoreductase [Candidatus Melainabacteria bacterium]